MKNVTINTDNFDLINYINAYSIHGNFGYVTKAKDRNGNNGILLFIPSNNENEIIESLKD